MREALEAAAWALRWPAFVAWMLFSVGAVVGLLGLLYRPRRGQVRASHVEAVIVSRADARVAPVLVEAARNVREKLGLVPWVVVDEGSTPPQGLAGRLVVVPRGYRPDLVGKGRAMNYFAEHVARDDRWYIFLDDDNLVLDDSVLYEIPEYEKEGYAAATGVLWPRRGKSLWAFIMDHIRYMDDVLVFRLFTGLLGRPLLGLHGELLTVRGDVLRQIGFREASITEDFLFASHLVRRGLRVWQSGTRVSILSPNSVVDLVRQRARWFRGLVRDVLRAPVIMQAAVWPRLLVWVLGLVGSWALAPMWLLWGPFWYALPGALLYWGTYLFGLLRARAPHYFFLIPSFGIVEGLSPIAAPFQKGFVVINKADVETTTSKS